MKLFYILAGLLSFSCGKEFYGSKPVCSTSSLGSSGHTSMYSATGNIWLVESATYQSSCCGVVTSWTYYPVNSGYIYFIIWRKSSDAVYKIAGYNKHFVDNSELNSQQTYDPSSAPSDHRLMMQNGDYIGWFSVNDEVLGYGSVSDGTISRKMSFSDTDVAKEAEVDWSSSDNAEYNKIWSLKANVVAGNAPSLTFPTTLSLKDTNTVGTKVMDVTYSDDYANTMDYDIFMEEWTDSSGYFELDLSTTPIALKTTSTYIPEGTYTMTFIIYTTCLQSNSRTVTITVSNEPVRITNLPAQYGNLPEKTDRETCLYTVRTSDSSAADKTFCDLRNPQVGPMIVKQLSASSYNVCVHDHPQLNYDNTDSYTLNIDCTDGTETASSTFEVTLERNGAPYFTNIDWDITIDAEVAAVGDIIYTVSATDPEGDVINYGMTCSPSSCPFIILNTGEVVVDTMLIHLSDSTYELYPTLNDNSGHATVGGRTITVTIENINSKPKFNNIPSSALSVKENSPISLFIYQFSATDADVTGTAASDTLTYSASFSHSEGFSLFELDKSTGILATSSWNVIDRESLSDSDKAYKMRLTVSDGKYADTATVTISVINENEAPVFLQKYYSITTEEGEAGTALPAISWQTRNPDGDPLTYSFNCGSDTGRFKFDRDTGQVTFKNRYDLDVTGTPANVLCTATITDGKLSDKAELSISVEHVNDGAPVFSRPSYFSYLDCTTELFTTLMKLYAYDSDGSDTDHGVIYYTLNQSTLAGDFFGIMQDGSIYTKADFSPFCLGETFTFTAYANDWAEESSSVEITVKIPDGNIIPTPSATTETPSSFMSNPENMYVFVPLCIAGGAVVLLTGGIIYSHGGLPSCQGIRNLFGSISKRFSKEKPNQDDGHDQSQHHRDVKRKKPEARRPDTPDYPPEDASNGSPPPDYDAVVGQMFRTSRI